MGTEASGGWSGAVEKFFDWKIWDYIGQVMVGAATEHPLLVFLSVLFSGLAVFGITIWHLNNKSTREHELAKLELLERIRAQTKEIRDEQFSSGMRELNPSVIEEAKQLKEQS